MSKNPDPPPLFTMSWKPLSVASVWELDTIRGFVVCEVQLGVLIHAITVMEEPVVAEWQPRRSDHLRRPGEAKCPVARRQPSGAGMLL